MQKILLLVTGMSPQIVTETLYGLAVKPQSSAAWIPDEIHLISTTTGIEQARLKLLSGHGYFARLCQDYNLPAIHFDESSLHPIFDEQSQALPDLKTPQDNEYAANTICEMVRELTQDNNTELHVSIAGGRKTMGFYAGYALSLYGRPQDSLSHVLVSEQYESLPDFFYPTPTTHVINNRDGKLSLDGSKAEVWLADIPFVRLRHHLPEKTLLHKATFSEVVQRIALATGDIRITIHVKTQTMTVNGISCKFSPRELAFYLWVIKKSPEYLIVTPVENELNTRYSKHFLTEYQTIKGEMGDVDAVAKGMDKGFFEQRLTAIRKILKTTYGEEVAKRLAISTKGKGAGYCLDLTGKKIEII